MVYKTWSKRASSEVKDFLTETERCYTSSEGGVIFNPDDIDDLDLPDDLVKIIEESKSADCYKVELY